MIFIIVGAKNQRNMLLWRDSFTQVAACRTSVLWRVHFAAREFSSNNW